MINEKLIERIEKESIDELKEKLSTFEDDLYEYLFDDAESTTYEILELISAGANSIGGPSDKDFDFDEDSSVVSSLQKLENKLISTIRSTILRSNIKIAALFLLWITENQDVLDVEIDVDDEDVYKEELRKEVQKLNE